MAKVIDRSKDIPHPDNWNTATALCGCGKNMIVMLDEGGMKLDPPQMGWYWKCFGCGNVKWGGSYHPRTKEEYHQERWEKAQG